MASKGNDDDFPEVLFQLMNSKGDKPGKTFKLSDRQYRYQNSKVPAGLYRIKLATSDIRATFVNVDVISAKNGQLLRKKVTLRNDEQVLEVDIKPESAPASIVVTYRILFPGLLGIRTFTKIAYKPYDNHNDKRPLSEIQRDVTLSILGTKSDFLDMAREKGFVRPFLLLASMHPSARREIAKVLGVKIKHIAEPHREAYALITTERKGLAARPTGVMEKASGHDLNWFDILVRTSEEAFRGDSKLNKYSLSVKEAEEACSDSSLTAISTMENTFLEQLAALHLKKLPSSTAQSINDVYQQNQEAEIFKLLDNHGLQSETVKKFALSFFSTDVEGFTTDRLVDNLQDRLFGAEDTTMNNTKKAAKAGKMAGMFGAHLVLLHLIPPVGIAFTAAMLANHIFGASTDVAVIAVINILLQKLLLIAQNIPIRRYY